MAQAKKAASKKSATPAKKTATVKPPSVKELLNKTQLTALLVEHSGIDKKSVTAVMASLEAVMTSSVSIKKGASGFVLPGLLKVTSTKVPAKPKRKGKDPFTGEERVFAAKPASVKVKVRPLKKLKDAAL